MSSWGEFAILNDYCNNTPNGKTWPVCAREVNHFGRHESADFWWDIEHPEPMLKGQTNA